MAWEMLLFGFLALVGLGATALALIRGVTWIGWDGDVVRRRTNPVGFWIVTAIQAALGAGSVFVLWRLVAGG